MKGNGLGARLGRTFLLQAVFISAAAVIGVFVASLLLEGVLIREALRDEAAHFWERREQQPAFPLPDTQNLTGYMDKVPVALAGFQRGYHDWRNGDAESVVYVTERSDQRLYLVFDRGGVRRLATYYGLLPLAVVLGVLYLSTWLAFRASRRAFSPVIALANEVRGLDPRAPDPAAFEPDRLPKDADEEVRELAAAIGRFAQRLNEFVDRERHFTRDASHELRSPLTVVHIAADMLLADASLNESGIRAAHRIKRAARDMEELISAFLLLARESEAGLPLEAVCVNDVVAEELERARLLAEGRPVEASVQARCQLLLEAPEKVIAVLIGNLLRNAFSYTDAGRVSVTIAPGRVVIEDTGIGMPAAQVQDMYKPFTRGDARRGGHGVGLTIVRRLSDRFGWPVEIASEPGTGTRVEVHFPGARAASLDTRPATP